MSSAGSLASPPAPPPDWQATAARFGIESPARAAIERVINPADYECGPSELDAFVDELLAEMTPADINLLVADGGLVLTSRRRTP